MSSLMQSTRRAWTCLLGVLLLSCFSVARAGERRYLVTINPDAARVAIAKSQDGLVLQLFEGGIGSPLRSLQVPQDHHFGGAFAYSPGGEFLYFELVRRESMPGAEAARSRQGGSAPPSELVALWRQRVGDDGGATTQKLFKRRGGLSNLLPLMDGSVVFMGQVGERSRRHWTGLYDASGPGWREYAWMRYQPDGTVRAIGSRVFAFFGTASLIRDEAVILVQERRINGRAMYPREYYVDVTPLRPGSDLSDLERRGSTKGGNDAPRWQCDWAGSTCARLTSYNKNDYLAHQLQISRDDKTCDVVGLPDRVEFMSVARDGRAVALIVRPSPREDLGYRLAIVEVGRDGCATAVNFHKLP